MNAVIEYLNQGFYQASFFSFTAAFLWGVLSVFLSPCHLGSIPLIIAYINEKKAPGRFRAFKLSLMFGAGILAMLIIIGVVTGIAGRLIGDTGLALPVIAAVFLMCCGLWLMDFPLMRRINITPGIKQKYSGSAGAFALGFLFGIILGPCSFAFIAPMIGLVFSKSAGDIFFGISLMCMYAIGHTAAIVSAGTFGNKLATFFGRKEVSRVALWIKRVCGGLVFVFGGWRVLTYIAP